MALRGEYSGTFVQVCECHCFWMYMEQGMERPSVTQHKHFVSDFLFAAHVQGVATV